MTAPLQLRPGLTVSSVRGPVGERARPPAPEHRVLVNVGRPYRLVETLAGTEHRTPGLPGDVAVVPAGAPFAVRSRDGTPQQVAALVVAVTPELLGELLAEGGVRRAAEPLPVVGARSPAVAALAGLLSAGLDDRTDVGRLALGTLAQALVAALARDHTTAPPAAPRPGGLSPAQLDRVLRHVEEHLAGPIGVADLAARAHVSEFHFSRQFRAATGTSPHRYVVRRRVERAHELLTRSDLPLAQVAVRCGFADQSHLTRHTRRELGAAPGALRAAARGR
ncbi:helix-turn-helix domain-containing protein [Geodermatophilus sp. SYSU D00710]